MTMTSTVIAVPAMIEAAAVVRSYDASKSAVASRANPLVTVFRAITNSAARGVDTTARAMAASGRGRVTSTACNALTTTDTRATTQTNTADATRTRQ